ncbi:hypothetical protein BCR35DRAFT_327461 [Leucosporidium creatinivorum]|uniref:Uncharacterized protein n=1 Tax=Leucosporidium creatinivorum TaxID=106004 RepID=A0A1Y2C1I4_9BASI|nr:hypothetical protein BCR35DRAFT_327461 [Leucosporidium creatinivorum]
MPPAAIPGTAKLAQANNSVRAKSKQDNDARKTVFRPVLDNPLSVAWPPVPAHIRQQLLDALLLFLSTPATPEELPIADWRLQEHARRRGRVHGAGKGKGKEKEGADELGGGKRAAPAGGEENKKVKRTKGGDDATPMEQDKVDKKGGATHQLSLRSGATPSIPDFVDRPPRIKPAPPAPLPRPKLLDYMSVGINEVTRALESRVRWGRWELGDPTAAPGGGLGASKSSAERERGDGKQGEDGKKTKKNRRKDRATLKPEKQVIRPPLDPLNPTSATTLSRPSYRFLTRGAYAPSSSSLPPYLLPPTERNAFFRMLANAHSEKVTARRPDAAPKPGKRLAATLLTDVMKSDDPQGAMAKLVQDGEKEKSKEVGQQEPSAKKKGASQKAVVAEPGEEEVEDWVPVLDLIFVCKPDINPPSLVAHLPTMAAAANGVQQALDETLAAGEEAPAEKDSDVMDADNTDDSTGRPKGQDVFLVPLDIGAERKLADALALRRVAAIGLSSNAPGIAPLLSLIRTHIQPLRAPWLVPHLTSSSLAPSASTFIPTHVKHLRTTAPLNPKAANAAKKAAKKEKKELKGVYVVEEDD